MIDMSSEGLAVGQTVNAKHEGDEIGSSGRLRVTEGNEFKSDAYARACPDGKSRNSM